MKVVEIKKGADNRIIVIFPYNSIYAERIKSIKGRRGIMRILAYILGVIVVISVVLAVIVRLSIVDKVLFRISSLTHFFNITS